MADVVLRGIRKAYGEIETIHGVDLEIKEGEFVVFVGPSGCGKSTLLRLIAGLEDITAGELLIGEDVVNNVPPAQRGISMVFQSYALYPHMSCYDNMAFGLKLAHESKENIEVAVQRAAKILQVEHLLDRKPKALSGGQRQRIAIGRAIVRKPKVFLFDEPLSNLDAGLRVQMRIEISKLHNELKTTMIYVTHDQVEAMTLADKIVVLSAGNVEQVGAPLELYHHPRNVFVAGFIGSPKMNFIEGVLTQVEKGVASVKLPSGNTIRAAVDASRAKLGDKMILGIRPEHFVQGNSDVGCVTAKVVVVERLGDTTYVHLESSVAPEGIVVRMGPESDVKAGEIISVGLPETSCHLFNADGIAFKRVLPDGVKAQPR